MDNIISTITRGGSTMFKAIFWMAIGALLFHLWQENPAQFSAIGDTVGSLVSQGAETVMSNTQER